MLGRISAALLGLAGCDYVLGLHDVDERPCREGSADEDHDNVIDGCDPCPADPETMPVDGDGDGVDDVCDPYPAIAGDRIVLFDGFTTDLKYQVDKDFWGHTGGEYLEGNHAVTRSYLSIDPTDEVTVDAMVDSIEGSTGAGAGIVVVLDDNAKSEVDCMIFQGAPDSHDIRLDVAGTTGTPVPFAFVSTARLKLTELADGSFTCDASTPAGETAHSAGPAGTTSTVVIFGFRSASAVVRYGSVTVFDRSGPDAP
ncbi:MAG: hypothetical protein QM831_45735 [Kofleriaceae bacterium]